MNEIKQHASIKAELGEVLHGEQTNGYHIRRISGQARQRIIELEHALAEANYPRYSQFEKPCFCEVNERSPKCPIHGDSTSTSGAGNAD